MWRSLFVLCCVAVATAIDATDQERSNLTPATVRIHHERSTDSELQATVEAYGKTHQLTLKKISMPEVTIQELDFENGTISIVDVPVEQEDATFFEDQNTGAFFYMNDPNTLEGMLTDSVVLKYDNGKHVAAEINEKTSKPFCASEQLKNLPEEEDKPEAETRGISFLVELTAIVDSSYLKTYRNRRGIIQYLTVYYNMVNRRFKTVSGANIKLRLTSVIVNKSPSVDTEFLTGRGSLVDSMKSIILTSGTLAKYRKQLKTFDIAHLLTQRDLYSVANGTISKGNTGIGWVGYPCYRSKTETSGIGITEDNAFYQGMLTTAHEIGHNLGSPHDPKSGGQSNCSWTLGYLMSYIRDSYKTFYFSPCSSKSIRATYFKQYGGCLKSTSNPNTVASLNPKLPGLTTSLTSQCRKFIGQKEAYPNPFWSSYKQCYRLSCLYKSGKGYRWQSSGYPALEGTRCSKTGRCLHGKCRKTTE